MKLPEVVRRMAAHGAAEVIMTVVHATVDPEPDKEDFNDILKRIEKLLEDEVVP